MKTKLRNHPAIRGISVSANVKEISKSPPRRRLPEGPQNPHHPLRNKGKSTKWAAANSKQRSSF
jgi:hypothetical protein